MRIHESDPDRPTLGDLLLGAAAVVLFYGLMRLCIAVGLVIKGG